MPNTTNFNWTTPADTDLVKDGALAIRTLANGIDTSLVDLKGGTTGQVLAKATNTDLDFSWVAQDDSNAIQNAIIDAKGDLIVGTAADTPARLAVGATNGHVLTVDSAEASGMKWASAAATTTFTLINSGGTSLSGSSTTVSSISGKNQIFVFVDGGSATGTTQFRLRLNSDSGSNYRITDGYATQTGIPLYPCTAAQTFKSYSLITGTNSTGVMPITSGAVRSDESFSTTVGSYTSSATISSITILPESGTFDAGTVYVYGA